MLNEIAKWIFQHWFEIAALWLLYVNAKMTEAIGRDIRTTLNNIWARERL